MSASLAPIRDPFDFLAQLRAAIKEKHPLDTMEMRRCVIVRCPSNYGQVFSVMIEWEGSPPQWRIYISGMFYSNAPVVLVVGGRIIRDPGARLANELIKRFLAAHPANADGSPVWIEPRNLEGVSHG